MNKQPFGTWWKFHVQFFISKFVDDVVIIKTVRPPTIRPGWMERWELYSKLKKCHHRKSCRRLQKSTSKENWKLLSRRQRGDITRDLKGTLTPEALKICGGWFNVSLATKASAPPSCVRPHCRMSWRQICACFDLLNKGLAVKWDCKRHPEA